MCIRDRGNKQRLVPVSSVARDKVQIYLEDRRRVATDAEAVFLNNRGGALTRVMVFTIIRQAAARAGIEKRISQMCIRDRVRTGRIHMRFPGLRLPGEAAGGERAARPERRAGT